MADEQNIPSIPPVDPGRHVEVSGRAGPALLVGTRKGAWILRPDATRGAWTTEGPLFLGYIVNHFALDPRDGRTLLMGARAGHLGPTVFKSLDAGKTWSEAKRPPAFAGPTPAGRPRAVDQVFWLTPGHAAEPGVWFAGTCPEGVFRSEDGGESWESFSGWNDHARYDVWSEDPNEQTTPDGSPLHSIRIDPRDPSHIYLATSGGGVFESTDGGDDWRPLNGNVEANFLPDPEPPEFGQDTHCFQLHPAAPDVLYQQNHCGIYRLDRPGESWVRIGDNMPSDVGDIGFPIGLHPRDPDTAWVFPMDGTDVWPRTSPDGRPAVYRTRDGGAHWERHDRGFPSTQAWLTVKRQCMAVDTMHPVGVYVGTTNGQVWASADEGESWRCIAPYLPQIFSLEAVEFA